MVINENTYGKINMDKIEKQRITGLICILFAVICALIGKYFVVEMYAVGALSLILGVFLLLTKETVFY